VTRALEGLPGVSGATVSLERERAIVEYDPRALTVAGMLAAIRGSVLLPGVRRAIQRTARPRRGRQPG
jgi:copper chaperone CopZ